jgi:septal ring factor EnvC (AmiA/AmiB activator)
MTSLWFLSVLSALALLASAALTMLFFPLRTRVQQLGANFANREEVAAELASLRQEIRESRGILRELQETRAAYMDRVSEISAVNMTSQGQVLRLHRRGESVAAISSALQLPVGEVSLIVKVYEMTKTFPKLETRDMAL